MKKFFREFKEFISRGNVIDLAVGVIIGGAFSAIVTSLTDNIIKPLINCIGGAEVQGKIHLLGDNYIDYGAFISALLSFPLLRLFTKWSTLQRKRKNLKKKLLQLKFARFVRVKFLLKQ